VADRNVLDAVVRRGRIATIVVAAIVGSATVCRFSFVGQFVLPGSGVISHSVGNALCGVPLSPPSVAFRDLAIDGGSGRSPIPTDSSLVFLPPDP